MPTASQQNRADVMVRCPTRRQYWYTCGVEASPWLLLKGATSPGGSSSGAAAAHLQAADQRGHDARHEGQQVRQLGGDDQERLQQRLLQHNSRTAFRIRYLYARGALRCHPPASSWARCHRLAYTHVSPSRPHKHSTPFVRREIRDKRVGSPPVPCPPGRRACAASRSGS